MKNKGFTLVELSIVMIIIGLLIGGIFGGIRLIENANIQKIVQDLKSADSSGLSFRDIYGRLPGDVVSPSTRIPNCTSLPCSRVGNGNRMIAGVNATPVVLTTDDERFTFWHQLQAANLVSMSFYNVLDLNFGEGQPSSPINGGYRLVGHVPFWGSIMGLNRHLLAIVNHPSADVTTLPVVDAPISCANARQIDIKADDGNPRSGRVSFRTSCSTSGALDASWNTTLDGLTDLYYTLSF